MVSNDIDCTFIIMFIALCLWQQVTSLVQVVLESTFVQNKAFFEYNLLCFRGSKWIKHGYHLGMCAFFLSCDCCHFLYNLCSDFILLIGIKKPTCNIVMNYFKSKCFYELISMKNSLLAIFN